MTDSPVSPWQRLLQAIRRPFPWWHPCATAGPRNPQDDDRLDAEIAEFQLRLVEEALRDGGVGGIPFDEGNEETAYLAHPDRLMCRADDAASGSTPFFRERKDDVRRPGPDRGSSETWCATSLPRRTDGGHDIVRLLDEIDKEIGRPMSSAPTTSST